MEGEKPLERPPTPGGKPKTPTKPDKAEVSSKDPPKA